MRLSRLKLIGVSILAAFLSAPAWATSANSAQPGTLNYVEGQAVLNGQALPANAIGNVKLQAGQSLSTQNGKAEILLTPGVFLRLDNNSTVMMISPSLIATDLALNGGDAMVEVSEIHPQNNLQITEDGISTRLLKTGLYGFDATHGQVSVFDGEAAVQQGYRTLNVKAGNEVDLQADPLRPQKFDKQADEQSDMYRWSSLRASYVSEANADAAQVYVANGTYGPGWVGSGWYWDPWFGSYTFIPADGIFYSPFGFGYYSPLFVYESPVFVRGHFHHSFGPAYRPFFAGGIRPGFRGDGFRPGPVAHNFHAVPDARGFRPQAHAPVGGLRGGGMSHGAASFGGGTHGGGFGEGGFHGGGGRR